MKTIKLIDKDYESLCMLMGYAAGAWSSASRTSMPHAWRELTDWILLQGDSNSRTYFFDRALLLEQKEKELAEECGG